MSHRHIAEDLTRKISELLEGHLQREINIAQIMLPSHEVAYMMLKIASGINVAAILCTLRMRKAEAVPAELFDMAEVQIREQVERLKPVALDKLAQMEAGR